MTELHNQIAAIDLARVPTMTTDQSIPRKARAVLVRDLFKQLRLKGISVTVPNYSMAHTVDIRLPREPHEPDDYIGSDGRNYHNGPMSEMPADLPYKSKWCEHVDASKKIEEIIKIAFPAHLDRSDYQSDYFDNPWSID